MKLYCEVCRRIVDPSFGPRFVPRLHQLQAGTAEVALLVCGGCDSALGQSVRDRGFTAVEELIKFATGRAFKRGVSGARDEMYQRLTGKTIPKGTDGHPNWEEIPDLRDQTLWRPPIWNATGYSANAEWKRAELARLRR